MATVNDERPAWMQRRLKELEPKELVYWEDELYSDVAITNLDYREAVEEGIERKKQLVR